MVSASTITTPDAFRWAIDRAMEFHALPLEIREREIRRVMIESAE